jgi:ABC-type sugar transport system ATPase subunit
MAHVSLQSIHKSYGAQTVVHDLDLDVSDHEFIVLVGPSGCGKSTTLRMIAGLEEVSAGRVLINGHDVTHRPPQQRDIAMVFQSYALYPHMTAYMNMAFGLMKTTRLDKREIDARVREAAEILHIEDLLQRKPNELSGGQRQRVAIGRALVRKPSVFLFDEPLSNLDAKLRNHMRRELKRLHSELGLTVIYVTHDQVEAMTLGTRIAVMNSGRLQQYGTPMEVYRKPANTFVASFVGAPEMNLIPCRVRGSGDGLVVDTGLFALKLDVHPPLESETEMLLGIRPEEIFISTATEATPQGQLLTPGRIEHIELLGADALTDIRIGELRLTARIAADRIVPPGQQVQIGLNASRARLFDIHTGKAYA